MTIRAGATAAKSWDHTALVTRDLRRSVDFYVQAFGYECLYEARGIRGPMAQMMGIAGLSCDVAQLKSPLTGHGLELLAFAPNAGDAPTTAAAVGHVAFVVDDVLASLDALTTLGAVELGPSTVWPGGHEWPAGQRAVYCREPGGTIVELGDAADHPEAAPR
jgi:catechol 2,3-dioxygenase-like lactoylglutathione lyase family enzyme